MVNRLAFMILNKKINIVLIITFVFSLLFNICNAQFSFQQNNNEPVKLKESLIENELTKPRPGFKKRRLGLHTLFLEGGYFIGYYNGLRYSVNYDLLLQSSEKSALTLRIGAGLNKATNDSTVNEDEVFFPFGINLLFGHVNHFELGLGGYYFENRQVLNPYFSIGFRHQKPRGGFMYRIAFDLHLERVYDMQGRNIAKTSVMGPIVGIGWNF